jgi:hypothetical protein
MPERGRSLAASDTPSHMHRYGARWGGGRRRGAQRHCGRHTDAEAGPGRWLVGQKVEPEVLLASPGQLTRGGSATRLQCGLSNVNAHMSVTQFSRSGHVGWVNIALSSNSSVRRIGSPAMMTTATPDKPPDPPSKNRCGAAKWWRYRCWCARGSASDAKPPGGPHLPPTRHLVTPGAPGVPIRDSPAIARRGAASTQSIFSRYV